MGELNRNHFRMLLTFGVYVLLYLYVTYKVKMQFGNISTEGSILIYTKSIHSILIILTVIALLWWEGLTISNFPGELRKFMEYKSFFVVIALNIIVIVASLAIFFTCPGIKDVNGAVQQMQYVFLFPLAQIFCMMTFPPVNVQEVVFPGKSWMRFAFAAGTMVILVIFIGIWG